MHFVKEYYPFTTWKVPIPGAAEPNCLNIGLPVTRRCGHLVFTGNADKKCELLEVRLKPNETLKDAVEIMKEFAIMKKLNNKNIVNLIHAIPLGKQMAMVTASPIADLDTLLKKSLVPSPKSACQQIMDGLDFCHATDIIHCNLRPESILFFEDGSFKITDFTSSFYGKSTNHVAVASFFRAPEVDGIQQYTNKADIWSASIILIGILTNTVCFQVNVEKLIEFVSRSETRTLLREMRSPNPQHRPTAGEVSQLLAYAHCPKKHVVEKNCYFDGTEEVQNDDYLKFCIDTLDYEQTCANCINDRIPEDVAIEENCKLCPICGVTKIDLIRTVFQPENMSKQLIWMAQLLRLRNPFEHETDPLVHETMDTLEKVVSLFLKHNGRIGGPLQAVQVTHHEFGSSGDSVFVFWDKGECFVRFVFMKKSDSIDSLLSDQSIVHPYGSFGEILDGNTMEGKAWDFFVRKIIDADFIPPKMAADYCTLLWNYRGEAMRKLFKFFERVYH